MCYSSLLAKTYEEYVEMFRAPFDMGAFHQLYRQRELDLLLKIPAALDDILIAVDPINGGNIRESTRRWRAACATESARLDGEIFDLETIAPKNRTAAQKEALKTAKSRRKRLGTALQTKSVEGDTYRIYPKYFAPVIIDQGGQRKTVPMRYRVLPRTGVEIPDQYNLFNARRDSLMTARNWKSLFGRKHALFPFLRFYEWVITPAGKTEISFVPDGYPSMWAASLYEEYNHPQLGLIRSFAMVTDEPPPEVRAAGHDRCPVFIRESCIDAWLQLQGQTPAALDALLDERQPVYFSHTRAA
jgi:putative SOS response-associated peptidase YedK